jgi:hypothetical protein
MWPAAAASYNISQREEEQDKQYFIGTHTLLTVLKMGGRPPRANKTVHCPISTWPSPITGVVDMKLFCCNTGTGTKEPARPDSRELDGTRPP